jgi:integrase
MGETRPRRRKGQGGLYIVRGQAWNEFKQTYEEVDFYQASKDISDPENPDKRKRIRGTGRTPQEAQQRLDRAVQRFYKKKGLLEAGVELKSRSKTTQKLSDYVDEWLSELRPDRVSQTLRLKYKQNFFNHILPTVGHIHLEDLSYQHLQKLFYETLPAKRKVIGGVESDQPLLGTNTLLNVYRTASVALKVAYKKGYINRNPLELVDTPRYQPPKENIPQVAHIVDHIFKTMAEANDPLHDHFILALLGFRKAERLGLTFAAMTLTGSNPKIVIQSQLQRVSGEGLILKPATKSGKDRSIVLQEPWLSAMKRMKEVRKQQLKLPGFKPEKRFEDLVYLTDQGKPFDLNKDNEMWKKVNDTYAQGKPIRPHSMRHAAATRLADLGVDREIVMAVLGHSSESLSHYYGRLTAQGQKDQMGRYSEAVLQKITPKK